MPECGILLLNGPNLNLLGKREPAHYGKATLADIEEHLRGISQAEGIGFLAIQSNHEGVLVDAVQRAPDEGVVFAIINPGAFTHTSIALRDAFLAVNLPFIEVHLSNIHSREPFRHRSFFSDIARGVIAGLGAWGYEAALRFALREMGEKK